MLIAPDFRAIQIAYEKIREETRDFLCTASICTVNQENLKRLTQKERRELKNLLEEYRVLLARMNETMREYYERIR